MGATSKHLATVFLFFQPGFANIRYWHLADIQMPPINVRFRG
jgi:hypothetical protein